MLKLSELSVACVIAILVTSCGKNVTGTYSNKNTHNKLVLTSDKKVALSGWTGTYTLEGNTIVLILDYAGSVSGEIQGSNLIFPQLRESRIHNFQPGHAFEGIWVQD